MPRITKREAKNFESMGSGKMQDLFGAIYMGVRHYKEGDFLRDLCAYTFIDDPEDNLRGGYKFYRERK